MHFFKEHNPFPNYKDSNLLVSISSVLKGDIKQHKCFQAYKVGLKSMEKMIGNNFKEVKYSRKDKVLPKQAAASEIKLHKQTVSVDPTLTFQKITLQIKKQSDMKEMFKFELAPLFLPLFDLVGMRKTNKSQLIHQHFIDELASNSVEMSSFTTSPHVVDGGYLLHKVPWDPNETVDQIYKKYVNYIKNSYSDNITIVFDDYGDTTGSTKSRERSRRAAREKGFLYS